MALSLGCAVFTIGISAGYFVGSQSNPKHLFIMAKVKYGEMISAMSGSINGTTHSRNRGGAYMRNRSIPVNPQTVAQMAIRAILAALSSAWRGLTPAQRNGWNSATGNFPVTDQFGDQRELSGHQLFVRLNSNLQQIGEEVIEDAPMPEAVAGAGTLALVANIDGSVMTVDSDLDDVPAGHKLVVEATPQLSPGISYAKNLFRVIATADAADPFPVDIFAAYAAKFGALEEGAKTFVRAYLVNVNTGQKGQVSQTSTIVIDEA